MVRKAAVCPHLPPEVAEHTIDFLRDKLDALKQY